ncbi:MAG: EamA family transporter RarD [Chloroflexota bacterium]|nr:EamA family transporter RarD [Chloroflexota bacterium]
MNKGMWYALGAYLIWGFLPLYWKALPGIPALEILSHRVVWSFLLLVGVLVYRRHWRWIAPALRNRKTLLTFLAATTLLAINWLVYIWAVQSNYVVESSLGYFMNPLVNVLLGMLFLGERLRLWQWTGIGVATVGVVYLTLTLGTLPWIGLTLAFSFGFYGLLRKTALLNALEGLTFETTLLIIPVLLYLFYREGMGIGSFGHTDTWATFLLIFSGLVTATPLLLFAAAARRVSLATMGVLQYLAPTIQFLLGVFLYGEGLTSARLIGFSLIWMSLLIYSVEGLLQRRRVAAYQYTS